MKERTLKIGKPTPLIGVATEPDRFDPRRPIVIILNSGIMHHVGSCRMSVRLARAIGAHDLLAVRFDYSGIGDSEPRRGSEPFAELAVSECVEVMDYLQKSRGASTFILYGLCSGADAAYLTALADARVVGVSQFDPFCYVTRRYYYEYYKPLIFDWARWRSFLGSRWLQLTRTGITSSSVREAGLDQFIEIPTYTRVFPPRDEVAAGLRALVDRGVRVQVNFPRGPEYNYADQFTDSFPDVDFRGQLESNFYPDANHIITQAGAQAAVTAAIVRWVSIVASPTVP